MVKAQECCSWITKQYSFKGKVINMEILLGNSVLAAASRLLVNFSVCKRYSEKKKQP